jgi:hypothetical protein
MQTGSPRQSERIGYSHPNDQYRRKLLFLPLLYFDLYLIKGGRPERDAQKQHFLSNPSPGKSMMDAVARSDSAMAST